MIKHATAGAFVFCRVAAGGWRLGLIEHPRLGRWMVPGGHVEHDECQAQAAVREVEEESGLTGVRFLEVPTPPLPGGFPRTHVRVPLPWWIIEQRVPADNHLAEPHVHVDHQYLAVVDDSEPGRAGEHPFAWFTADEVSELAMFEDSQLLALMLFSCIGDLANGQQDALEVLRPFAAAKH
ncbi:MAG: NUDIX hydrolase [Pseudonocardiaceae bacterium]